MGHERAPDGEHLLLPAGERPRDLLLPLFQDREVGEDVFERRGVFRAVTPRVGAERQVLRDGQLLENAPPLGDLCHAERHQLVCRGGGDVLAVEKHAPRRFRDEPGEGVHDGGLSGAVRADECDDLARVDVKVNAADRLDEPVIDLQARDFQ